MSGAGSFLDLIRIEPDSTDRCRYVATFQAHTPEGDFQVTVGIYSEDESRVFRLARHQMRRMLARLAAISKDWSVPPSVASNSAPIATIGGK